MRLYDSDQSTPTKLDQVDQTEIRPEQTLESWLHINPELVLDEQLLVIGRQVQLDTGVADLVCCDQYGSVVVVEVKIGSSGSGSASEKTILSQVQAYSSALNGYDYDDLNEMYQNYLERLNNSKWDVNHDKSPSDTLDSAFEATFGTEIATGQYNTEQRLVVVAERITGQTASNVRYLLEQGLHFTATEVRQFNSPKDDSSDETILASSMVVDYNLSRVRPERESTPTYPELATEILERAFPEFRSVVNADSLATVFPDGMDTNQHELVSNNPGHPDEVVYRLWIVLDDRKKHTVLVGIDVKGDNDEVHERIQANTDRFEANDFEVTGNKTHRVVVREWYKDPSEIRDIIDEVADSYGRVVQLGHDILVDQEAR